MLTVELSAAAIVGTPAKVVRRFAEPVERVAVVSEHRPVEPPPAREGYLPAGGSLSLRFATNPNWPPPIAGSGATENVPSKPADAAEVTPALPASAGSSISNETPPAPEPRVEVISAGRPLTQVVRPAAPDTELLTSDLVLGYLENRPNKRGGIPVPFQPANPPEAAAPDAGTPATP